MKINKYDVLVGATYVAIYAAFTAWALYLVYVLQYGFNHVVSPIMNIGHITYLQAMAINVFLNLIGCFKIESVRAIRTATNSKVDIKQLLIIPPISHFLLWLLVG